MQWIKGDTTGHTHRWTFPEEEYSVDSLSWECSNSAYFILQIRKIAKKQIWWTLLQQLGTRPHLSQNSDNHRTKERTCSIFSAGTGHLNVGHESYQGDNGQHTLRKVEADIYTKHSSCTTKY